MLLVTANPAAFVPTSWLIRSGAMAELETASEVKSNIASVRTVACTRNGSTVNETWY